MDHIYLNDEIDVVDELTPYTCDVCNEKFTDTHMDSRQHKLKTIDLMKMVFMCDKQRYREMLQINLHPDETKFRNQVDGRIKSFIAGDRLTLPSFNEECIIKDKEYCHTCAKDFSSLRSHLKSSRHKDKEITNYIRVILDESDEE